MSKLTKEEVISALESALSKQEGKTVAIEQKGSWYKIDGGKSLRFSELETMLAELGGEAPVEQAKAEPAKAPAAKKPAAKKPAANKSGGKTPKELWREKLAGKGQLPRGF
ncbi:hypothetical protein [Shewanella waksmanii]|uniref:hypothetical protein n=1 Tax=Shewanella waksmanii TaxID=213783 RepID=UPI003736695C